MAATVECRLAGAYGWMTAARVPRPVAVSMARDISDIRLPASAATTVAPKMVSVPALHSILTKPAATASH